MSDAKQPEQMRPIPDGGLKDTMPSWLKRPPAWRDLPTVEQRHERSLPGPDISEIDPRSLVDVTDLPQWLQAIAARGEIPVPTPDASVDHAVEVVQATQQPIPVPSEPEREASPVGSDSVPGLEVMPEDPTASERLSPLPEPTPSASARFAVSVWMWPVAALVIIALFITLYILM